LIFYVLFNTVCASTILSGYAKLNMVYQYIFVTATLDVINIICHTIVKGVN